MADPGTVPAAVEQAHREHWGHRRGVPDRPQAWLLATARNRAIDVLRREASLARKLPLLVVEEPAGEPGEGTDEVSTIADERLRLLFTCCHPALAPESRVALTLRCV